MAQHRKPARPAVRLAAAAGVLATSALGGLLVTTGVGHADPITCPSGQESTKTDSGWDCQNGGGNLSNAEDPKNPNASKGDF